MNSIDAKRAQLKREAEELTDAIARAVQTKKWPTGLSERVSDHATAKKEFERQAQRTTPAWALGAADAGSQPDYSSKRLTGRQLSPMEFSDTSLKRAFKAFKNGENFTMKAETKGYSDVDSLLPAQLNPSVVAHIHENRLLDKLPAIAISAPSYEFIVHNFAADSGVPAPVSIGGTKPEYIPGVSSQTATAIKLAVHTGISHETLSDWNQWLSYVETELYRQMTDVENTQLLNGSGSGGNMTGFLQTSGILTHNCSSDPSSWTAIDSIEQSISQLRVSTALAEADLLVLHPTCWAAVRRIKSTVGNYIAGDPLQEAVSRIWGVPVLVTTAIANGAGLLLDTTKMGHALIREGIIFKMGYSGTDFVQNISRIVCETRLTLAVERPTAVLSISNLPTS
jgi:HK97 family phage major capsid protein